MDKHTVNPQLKAGSLIYRQRLVLSLGNSKEIHLLESSNPCTAREMI